MADEPNIDTAADVEATPDAAPDDFVEDDGGGGSGAISGAARLELPSFDPAELPGDSESRMTFLGDVNLNVKIELGRSRMYVEDVLRLNAGSVIELDKPAGDPVDVYINDRHIARGEVLVVNDCFCVRISEIMQNVNAIDPEDGGGDAGEETPSSIEGKAA